MPRSNSAFNIIDSVDSTNNYAMAKVHAGLAKHGDAWFAHEQTAGKGQRGKKWHTGAGKNIALSIVMQPSPLLITEQFKLSAAVALACLDFFRMHAGEETKIKWPNDIYWRDRKAGGILIENVIGSSSTWKFAIAGIGFNINDSYFDPLLTNAVSLKQITGQEVDVVKLAKQLHQLVLKKVEELFKKPFADILHEYNQNLYKINKLVLLRKNNIDFETAIRGVMENGRLYTTDRIDNFFDFGEVEWVL